MKYSEKNTTFIGLGSNLDDPILQIKIALLHLEKLPLTKLQRISSFYRSAPMGPADQPDYINAVVEMKTELTAEMLIDALLKIEEEQNRERKIHWGPRTIDLDILLYEMQIIHTEHLTIPHVGIKDREFVLFPLYEIAPTLSLPTGERIVDLCAQCHKKIERLEEIL